MIKRSMSRNTRVARGGKVKHIVQILLLLGVCIWLIYQVKHSHDKKRELNDDDEERLSGKMQNNPGFLKLGRKELNPRIDEVKTREKNEEEDEDENGGEDEETKHEEDDPQEDNKEEENQEQEEAKQGEAENEERGGGDDEIDDSDQESEENADFIDDEKEKDDETDEKGDREEEEEEISSEENDGDGDDEKSHEAREEHYKGDDASSAVTHNTRLINSETEETNLDSSNLEHENSKETNGVHDSSRMMEEGTDRTTEDGNSTAIVDLDGPKYEDKASQDLILATQLNEQHPEANDTNQVKTEVGSGSSENLVSSLTQQAETIYSSNETQSPTIDIPTDGSTGNDLVPETTYSNSNLTISLKDDRGNGSIEVPSKSSNETGLGSLEVDGETGVTEEEEDGENGAQEDPIDSSDSGVAHEMEETRMDLDTLPDIRPEIDNSDIMAAE